jgi:hypothetical protein
VGIWLVAIVLCLGTLWNAFTVFYGSADFFDLAMNPSINPTQFTFAIMITLLVLGFVIGSHIIMNLKSDDVLGLFLKAAYGLCVLIDALASWDGTRRFVFYGDYSGAFQEIGLVLVTVLVVASTILLSKLLLGKDIRGKPFLF